MTSEVISRETDRFYPERPGANIDESIAILSSPPEFSPNEEEKRRALTIESALTVGVDLYSTLLNDERSDRPQVRGVEKIYLDNTVNTLDFFVEYFTTNDEGRKALIELGFTTENGDMHDSEVVKFLSGLDYSSTSINANAIAKVAGNSQKFIEEIVAGQMEKNNFQSLDGLTVPTKITIVKNPDMLAGRITELRNLKRFLKKLSKSERMIDSPQITAIVNMHRRRVNELIAESYPDAIALVKQYKASPTEKSQKAIEKISKAAAISFESDDIGSYALARLDKFLNGAGEDIKDGDYSPISDSAVEVAQAITNKQGEKSGGVGVYEEYRDVFKKAKVEEVELHTWLKKVIGEYGILSSEDESKYTPDRASTAPDGNWQVVIHPSVSNVAINGKQRVVKIPREFNRNLTQLSPAGVVPLADHELEHVVQWENKKRLGLSLTSVVKIDRSDVYEEGGGIMQETDAQSELFGQDRGTAIDYINASWAKLNGLNYLDCVMAFFNSNMAADPEKNKRKAADLAANRALRLFRNEGDLSDGSNYLSNSQPLVYLEQDLVVKKLKEKGMEKLLHFGINLDVLADLHRVGMIDINNIWVPNRKTSEILDSEIREKFEKASAN